MFKKWYVWLTIILVVVGGAFFGLKTYQVVKDKEFNKYQQEYENCAYDTFNLYVDMGNDTESVWKDIINDDVTSYNGNDYDDIDEAMAAVNNYYKDSDAVKELQKYDMQRIAHKLESNVTSNTKNMYEKDKKINKYISEYGELLKNPLGNYDDYSSSINDAYRESDLALDSLHA